MKIRAFITHKLKEDYSSCQDRFHINPDNKSIAVSDGMSQSIFPDYWADIVSEHVANEFRWNEDDRLSLCNVWKERVLAYIEEEKRANRNPWRLEGNLSEGYSAGCTLCGVSISNRGEWKGIVLGDSCIIEINKTTGKILNIYSSESKQFDSYPDYVDSNPQKKGRGEIRNDISGKLDNDICILLVSDPFSEFLFNHQDDSEKYIDELLKIENHTDYLALVEKWRREKMHNDDSTMIIVESDGEDDFKIVYSDNINNLIKTESEDCETLPQMPSPIEDEEKLENNLESEKKSEAEGELDSEKKNDPSVTSQCDTNQKKLFEQLELNGIIDDFIKDYKRHFLFWWITPKRRKKELKYCIEEFTNILKKKQTHGMNKIRSISMPECVMAERLQGGHPVYDKSEHIVHYTGGYCCVFPYVVGSKKYAVRYWHVYLPEAEERIDKIAAYLKKTDLPYFVNFEYIKEGIATQSGIQPIVIMDWVEADTLKEYISQHLHEKDALLQLANSFRKMAADLHKHNISHGDLQHDNILVHEDGSLTLVDYDSMYVPDLAGQPDIKHGVHGYQHPARFANQIVSPKADYFSELVIYISIIALAEDPELWTELEMEYAFTMIFSAQDIKDVNSFDNAEIVKRIKKYPSTEVLVNKMREQLAKSSIEDLSPLEECLGCSKSKTNLYSKILEKIKKTFFITHNKK